MTVDAADPAWWVENATALALFIGDARLQRAPLDELHVLSESEALHEAWVGSDRPRIAGFTMVDLVTASGLSVRLGVGPDEVVLLDLDLSAAAELAAIHAFEHPPETSSDVVPWLIRAAQTGGEVPDEWRDAALQLAPTAEDSW